MLQPQLRALRQRIALLAQLRPLTAGETCSYVEQRLRLAGLEGQLPFCGAALEEIHRRTQGVPRLINLLCDSCLGLACQMHRRDVDTDIVRAAVSGLTLTTPAAAIGAASGPSAIEPRPMPTRVLHEESETQRRVAGGQI